MVIDYMLIRAPQPGYWYYYLVRDPNQNYFNTGIRVTPSVPEVRLRLVLKSHVAPILIGFVSSHSPGGSADLQSARPEIA